MNTVGLSGVLVCRDDAEAAIVREQLARHVELTRAESGCLAFDVEPTSDPLVWTVRESFRDAAAFRSHQRRVRDSEWGRRTALIERRYEISGL